MMWKALVVALLVAAASADQGWKTGSEYKYQVRGRTLTALHQVANQYTGVVLRAQLTVQPKSDNLLTAKVSNAEYAKVHQEMPAGWGTPIPDSKLSFRSLPVASKPFQIKLKNGIVDELIVSKSVPTWEVNILKSIVSQLQVDTKAENLISSRINNKPSHGSVNGVYKTMEDDVTGECEVMYDISPLPQYQLQSRPELAPMPQLRGDGQLIDIVKTKNFSHCEQRPGYHFGLTALSNAEPAAAKMGEFMARSSVSRVVLTGSLQRYTIQSSVTTNKVILSPVLYDNQKGMVVSRMNLTLESVHSASGSPQGPAEPRKIKDLVYDYNDPFSTTNNAGLNDDGHYKKQQKRSFNDADDSSSDSSSSSSDSSSDSSDSSSSSSSDSSDSNESQEQNRRMQSNAAKRFRRSLKNQQDSDSDSQSQENYKKNHKNQQQQQHGRRNNDSDSDSDDSSSDSQSNESQWGKNRRARSNRRSNEKNNDSSDSDSSSSSSDSVSSSEEWFQPKPAMRKAPQHPMLPFFVGYQGSNIAASSQVNLAQAAKKIAQQIGDELQRPSQIPEKATLAKFTILARLVRVMDTKDMEQVARELYEQAKPQNAKSASHSESASVKISAWKAYRDAVAQAGTNPALLMIESWIQQGYVKGEEAAELLAVLPETARTPTREYMDTFFKLMKKSEIQKQQFLNVSAVIAFTDLARRAQVDNATAHDRYPTHVYGRLNPKKASAVARDYIPYLAQQLKSAVQEGDSHKVQVYTRALGNIAHPKILAVFEPYLEGQKPVSTFQRLHMVVALNKLAKISPKVARPVLFRVYQNAGEAAEIRSAAVFMLMKTNPPASMLQRMAEFTNQDPSKQVRSVVKSAIESAANRLWSQDQQELAENARAAVDMLNATLNGVQYSKVLLKSDDVEQMSLAYKAALATIGSDDSYIPSAAFVSARANLGGFQANYLRAGAMASSVSDLIDLLAEQFQQQGSRSSHKSGKRSGRSGHSDDFSASGSWSADKIANMLNIQPDQAEQVEANFLINVLAQQRFFTLDNHTVEQIPHYLEKAANTLRSGENFNYTKLYNRYALTMGFPTEMGLPLVYTLKAPTLVKVGGEARVRTQPDIANGPKDSVQIPNAVNASADIHFTYSTRTEAKLGFVTPFDHQRYIAGLDKDVLVNLPIRANMDLDLENAEVRVKLQPIKAEKDFKIIQISAQPYTAQHDILNLSPVPEQKPIKLRKEPQQANFTVGQDMTGMAFRIDAATEGDFADFAAMYNQAKNYDGISALLFPTAEQTIKAYELSVSYDHQKTSAKSVTLTASYDNDADEENNYSAGNDSQEKHAKKSKRSNKNNANDDDSSDYDNDDFSAEQGNNGQNAANPSNASPNSQSRQQQFLRRAAAGIKSANTSVIDLSAQFNGEHKAQFIATAAYANSQVDEKARVLVYLRKVPARSNSDNKEQQLAMTATAKMPNVPYMDFQKALNADPKSQIQAQIVFGEKLDSSASKITIQAQMKQTNTRKEFVSRQPMSVLCQEQMQRGNKFLPACQNATIEANIMDLYTADIHFDKLSQRVKNATYKAYAAARYFGWQYNYENFVNPKNSHNNKVELQLRFAPNLKSANLSIDAPAMSAEFNNVRLNPWVARAAAIHPMHSQVELIAKKALGGGFPMCVVDQSAANTFDNKTYPLNLGNNWHVMMQSVPKDSQDNQNNQDDDATDKVSVLVRDAGSHDKKELKVILDEDVVEFTPSSGSYPNIKINGHSVSINSGKTAKLIGRSGSLLAEVYPLPANTIKFYAWEQKMEVVYDGARVALIVGQTYRGEIRGLCGTFDSQKATDFKTPRNCILKNPQQFAATWAINPSGAVKEQQQKAEQAACFPERVLYGDVISDREAGRYHQQQSGSRRARNSGKASRYNNDSNDSNSSSSSDSNSDESASREQQQSGKQSACTQHRVKVIQEHGKTCFSLRPLPQCGSSCKPTKKVEKNVDFHCTYNHPAASHWVEMIKKGANPDFSQKGANHQQMVSMPESCRAH